MREEAARGGCARGPRLRVFPEAGARLPERGDEERLGVRHRLGRGLGEEAPRRVGERDADLRGGDGADCAGEAGPVRGARAARAVGGAGALLAPPDQLRVRGGGRPEAEPHRERHDVPASLLDGPARARRGEQRLLDTVGGGERNISGQLSAQPCEGRSQMNKAAERARNGSRHPTMGQHRPWASCVRCEDACGTHRFQTLQDRRDDLPRHVFHVHMGATCKLLALQVRFRKDVLHFLRLQKRELKS